jgi:hypothetical protein
VKILLLPLFAPSASLISASSVSVSIGSPVARRIFFFPCFAVGGTLQRSGDIAEQMGVKVNAIGPLGSTLIDKGMIHSPSHGETSLPSRFLTAFSSANSRFRES